MSKIKNFEWGVLIGVAILIDAFQLVLDVFAAGIFINPPLDIFIGVCFVRYFRFRGVNGNWKQWISWISAPLLEFLTASIFPLGWVIEVIATMLIDKAAGKITGSADRKDDSQNREREAA